MGCSLCVSVCEAGRMPTATVLDEQAEAEDQV